MLNNTIICAKSLYLADLRSQQRAVVTAYIDFCHAVVPFASGLLKENFKSSKSLIFEISPGSKFQNFAKNH